MKEFYNKLVIVSLFAVAMGLLESAVVIYLREIMYPEGFGFPLSPVKPGLAVTEILREAATLIMLFAVGLLAGRTFSERFAWFVFSFALWDIFYYVFLWLLTGWPDSLLTWDILFLIPFTWTGPVITPLIVTVVMILFSGAILLSAARNKPTRLLPLEWGGLIIGSLVLIAAFTTDYMVHMLDRYRLRELIKLKDPGINEYARQYIPESFPWLTFAAGIILILTVVFRFIFRMKRSQQI